MTVSSSVVFADSQQSSAGLRFAPLRHLAERITTEPLEAAWIEPTVSQIVELMRLPNNWDSYGAARISESAAFAMVDVLRAVLPHDVIKPWIVPSSSGHLQAEWHVNGIDLEVEVVSATSIFVAVEGEGNPWDDHLKTDLTKLAKVFGRLRAA